MFFRASLKSTTKARGRLARTSRLSKHATVANCMANLGYMIGKRLLADYALGVSQ